LGTKNDVVSIERSVDGLEQEKGEEQLLVVGNLINATESISADKEDKERGCLVDKQGGASDERGSVTDREEQEDAVDEKVNVVEQLVDQAADIDSTATPVLMMTEGALSKSNEEITALENSGSAAIE
jgi:hypothetical protein